MRASLCLARSGFFERLTGDRPRCARRRLYPACDPSTSTVRSVLGLDPYVPTARVSSPARQPWIPAAFGGKTVTLGRPDRPRRSFRREIDGAEHSNYTGERSTGSPVGPSNRVGDVTRRARDDTKRTRTIAVLATVLFHTDIVGFERRRPPPWETAYLGDLSSHATMPWSVARSAVTHAAARSRRRAMGFLVLFSNGPAPGGAAASPFRDAFGATLGSRPCAPGFAHGRVRGAMGENVGGIAVHIGARISRGSRPRRGITFPATVKDLVVGLPDWTFDDRGNRVPEGRSNR
jgi:hypothetical protein